MQPPPKPSPQVRLLAVELGDHLFSRSHIFRALLVSHLDEWLARAAGHRPRQPLPGAPPAAAALRAAALAALDRWRLRHGRAHPQLALACRYLQETARLRFPEPSAAPAAAAERAAREQEELRARFGRVAREFDRRARGAEELLTQAAACIDLLAQAGGPLRRPAAPAAPPQPANGEPKSGGEDEDEWEDVRGGSQGAAGGGGRRRLRLAARPAAGAGDGSGAEEEDGDLMDMDPDLIGMDPDSVGFDVQNGLAAYVPEDDPT